MKPGRFRHRRAALAGVLSTVALPLAMSPSPAAAATATVVGISACDNAPLTQPFLPWHDQNDYKLAPGGSFESGSPAWTLSGGARIVSGSEPFAATGSLGARSLSLPVGSSATSPTTCVNAAYPTLRFFARNTGLLSSVLVQVVYQEPLLGTVVLPVGTATLSAPWAPSAPMLTASALPGLLSNGTAQMALRFTAVAGSSQIDDVFVDPRLRT